MTEATFTSPRLERPHEAPLAGVCLALARTTGTDVVLWRVLFVVLTVFGGLGVALYLASYVSIPAEGEEHSLVSRLLHGPDRTVSTRQVLLLALVLVVAAAALHDNGGAVVVAGLVGLGFLWWRRRHPSPVPGLVPSGPPTATTVAAAGMGTAPLGGDGTTGEHDPGQGQQQATAVLPPYQAASPPYQAPVWTPPPPKPRSVVTPLTLSVGALSVGVLLLVAAAGSVSVPTEVVLAVALGVVGLGLVVSAFVGRARGLVPVAVLLALALGGTFGARPAIDHGIGERTWTATAAGSYRLGIGHGTLALPANAEEVGFTRAAVTFGQLTVLVPEGLHVVVKATVTNGDIQGFGVDENGRRVTHTFDLGPKGAPAVVVDAHVGAGMVEVRRG